jgi:hypothetical protein
MSTAQDRFVEQARQHGAATREGDHQATNRAYYAMMDALREIRAEDDRGVKFLSGCLVDEDPSVITWAALHLLPYREDEALTALQKVADGGFGLISFGAETTMEEWKAGRLVIE